MIEFELPEPEFEDLALLNVDPVRDVKGAAPQLEPLRGRVQVGGPHGSKITAKRAAEDEELRQFLNENNRYQYYFVFLAVSFKALGTPRLESSEVKLTLTTVPEDAYAIALSMKPLADGDPVSVTRKVTLGPKLKLLDAVDVEVGGFEGGQEWQRSDLVVRAEGLATACPRWVFTRTSSRRLEGSCMLNMVVRAGRSAALTVSGEVTARSTGNLVWHFARDLPNPLAFTADF
jgi:hypothetical protein